MWEIYHPGSVPYHGTTVWEVKKAVLGGRRLKQHPSAPIGAEVWATEPSARPSMDQIHSRIQEQM